MGDRFDRFLESTVVGSFSSIGYASRRGDFAPLPSMDGKTALITGATSGIGLAAAKQIASLGARTLVVGRNPDRLERAVMNIKGESGGTVRGLQADLSSLTEVHQLAENVLATEELLHVLVNNVSVLPPRRIITDDDIELTVATNLVAPFVLTNLLIPRLVESAPARIVMVSSGGMYTQPLDVDGFESTDDDFNGTAMYAKTKRAQVVLAEMWAEQLKADGVVAHAMHPGWVDTPGLASSLPTFRRITSPILRDEDQGADTITFLAASDEAIQESGLFWLDRAPRSTHRSSKTMRGAAERDRLWEYLCEAGTVGTAARPCAVA